MISLYDVLLAASNIPVNDPIAEIWGRGLQGGYKIIEYTGALPITITANGDALLDYRIYGADGGVGVATENLFDKNAPRYINKYLNPDGSLSTTSSDYSTTKFIKIKPSTQYTINTIGSGRIKEFDDFQTPIRTDTYNDFNISLVSGGTFTTSANAAYIRFGLFDNYIDTVMLAESVVPTSYIPYGYKLPMTVGNGDTAQTVPVYIGENQLDAGEYVSYGEQKIYRDVSGTLTPTDPPVPLPEIPTIKGETIIDYDGTPKPAQMYVKYKGAQ